jgi:thioredoxin-dependent peroxiredoxin
VKPGQPAPDFSGPSSRGDTFRLSDHRGKVVVLFFYPAAFTPGCTREAKGFAKTWQDFADMGAEVVGISPDTLETQCRFASELHLPYRLMADRDSKISELYGSVWPILGRTQRATFVIGPDGVVLNVFRHELRPRDHVSEARDAARLARGA